MPSKHKLTAERFCSVIGICKVTKQGSNIQKKRSIDYFA